MTEVFKRKAQPDCMRYIMRLMRCNKRDLGEASATIEQLVTLLEKQGNYAKPLANDTIHNAIHDGLLVPIVSSFHGGSPRGRLQDNRMVRLPELNEVMSSAHDFYCYECHLPGMLEFCRQCTRSFHRLCFRKDAERPNYPVPSAKLQKNRLPAFSSDTDSNSDAVEEAEEEEEEDFGRTSTIADYESDVRASSSLQAHDQTSLAGLTPAHFQEDITVDSTSSPIPVLTALTNVHIEGKPTLLHDFNGGGVGIDTKAKLEVVCMGEVRPPNRQRPAAANSASNVSYKSEITPNELQEGDVDRELCTCCRLLKSAAVRNPANIDADELCHLLNFTFERNRTWLARDVLIYLETLKYTPKECSVINKLLFKLKPFSLDAIAQKLRDKKYLYLMECFVDILDMQHHIGIFFGPCSTEFESTKWLIRDMGHDLSEIRRCADCFRYSHEKRSSVWFAKPCVQRHELVFAKHSGFPYWPAKVIRVLPNNKYDVRFFGGKHSRALLDVKFIKPIDTDHRQLKLGSSQAIKKAMEELRYHQLLSTYPPRKFSYHANKEETESIIRSILGRAGVTGKRRGRKRRLTTSTQEESSIAECGFVVETPRLSKKRKSQITQNTRITRSADIITNPVDNKKIQEDLEETLKLVDVTKKKNDKLMNQIQKLKETVKKYELEKKILKRKQWCYWCLSEAIYLCCFKAAYCSQVCQSRHWKDGHSKICKNREDLQQINKEATSTT